jgi:hypothetical protein
MAAAAATAATAAAGVSIRCWCDDGGCVLDFDYTGVG